MKPISIVVITYNEEKNISDCLDSLTKIDYPKYEIIVIDSSTDKTPDIVKKYKQVKLITTKNKGFASQRNLGYKKAKYDLVAYTDADCIVPKDWLRVIQRKLSKDIVAICGNAYTPEDAPLLGKWISCLGTPAGGAIGYDSALKRLDKGVKTIVTGNSIFTKEILNKVNGFDENLKYGGEDSDISERIRKTGKILEYEKDSYIYHKTRNTLSEFLKWNFRRGRANQHVKEEKSNLIKLFVFLPIWPILLLLITRIISFIIIITMLSLSIMALGSRKRFLFLLKRRKRIKVGLLTVLTIIPILFYIRHIARVTGELFEKWI